MLGRGSSSPDQAVSARFPASSAAPAASQPPGDMAPPLSSPSPAVSALFRPLQPLQQPSQIQHVPSSQVAGSFSSFGAKGSVGGDQAPAAGNETTSTRRASLVGVVSGHDEPEQEQDDDMPDMGGCDDSSASTSATSAQEARETTTQAPNGRATASEPHVVRKRNVGVPKFLRFLFQMLELEDRSIISWSHKGTAFQIRQPDELAEKILPKYFKHNKVSSFQRQLNYFGFKKWTKTQTNICTFSHPFFLRAEKDRMKLIKRKERGVTTTASPPEARQASPAQDLSQIQAPTPNLMLTQQALKRQKSNSLATGAAASFLNSAAAGRRHSTGMLPGAEAIGMAAAAAAASASASGGRKRAGGTPAELEFALELEARADAMTHAATPQQQLHHLRRLAEAKELSRRPPAKGKRKSLPQVLPPGFGDSLGTGMGMTMGMSMSGNAAVGGGRGIGRRKSDQMLSDFGSSSSSKGTAMMGQFGHFLASSTTSSMPQPANMKSDASAVLPITSDTLMQDAYHQQRQQMTRHANIFGGGVGYGAMETKPELQPPASGGWPASSHMPPQSSSSAASYHPQSGQLMPMLPFKFGDPNAAMSSFDGVSIMDYSHASEQQKLQQRHAASYQQQPTQQQPKDYIDVLLESAALDENLAAQSSATSWGEPNYPHNTQQNPSATGATTYALLTPQQQHQRQQQLQMSSMGGLPHHPSQRF